MNYQKFATWAEVLDHVRAGKPIFYQAPLDVSPRLVETKLRGKDKVRVSVGGHNTTLERDGGGTLRRVRNVDPFTADEGHLDRFRK